MLTNVNNFSIQNQTIYTKIKNNSIEDTHIIQKSDNTSSNIQFVGQLPQETRDIFNNLASSMSLGDKDKQVMGWMMENHAKALESIKQKQTKLSPDIKVDYSQFQDRGNISEFLESFLVALDNKGTMSESMSSFFSKMNDLVKSDYKGLNLSV